MPAVSASVAELIDRYRAVPGALLPLLHAIQGAEGFIPEHAVPAIATALNLSRAEVHGVVSFYHDFHTEPAGRQTVQICRAEACQALGARALEQHACNTLGIGLGQTTDDGTVTLEGVYCLGNCACGPSVRIGDRVYGRVDGPRFDTVLAACRAGEPGQ